MDKILSGYRIALVTIFALNACLIFFRISEREVMLPSEARVCQVARQMLRTGDWTIPYIGNEVRLKKPPLAYWLVAVSSLPFGEVTNFSSRLPNACAALGVLFLTYLFGRRLMGRNAAMLAVVMLSTTVYFWWQARLSGIEMPLLFFNLLCLYSWWHGREENAPEHKTTKISWTLLAYLCAALSFLQKGPVGPVLVGLIIIAYTFTEKYWNLHSGNKNAKGLGLFWHACGVILFLAVALPWFILAYQACPEAASIWRQESVGRYAGFDHIEPSYFPLLAVLLDGQPWVIFACLIFPVLRDSERRKQIVLPLVWLAITLLFFSIPASKKHSYLLPCYPALALLASAAIKNAFSQNATSLLLLRRTLIGFASVFVLGGFAVVGFLISPPKTGITGIFFTDSLVPALAGGLCVSIGTMILVYIHRRESRNATALFFCAPVLALSVCLAMTTAFNRAWGPEELTRRLIAEGEGNAELIAIDYEDYHLLTWYLDRQVDYMTSFSKADIKHLMQDKGPAYLVVESDEIKLLPPEVLKKFKTEIPEEDMELSVFCLTKEK